MQKDQKKAVMTKHQTHGKDTGSPQVQVAILTEKINALTEHLKTHAKDKHSRRGLIGMVGRRRKLLRYLQMRDSKAYQGLIKDLGIRK
jgi:small subunit ribosomal protein S15